MNLGRASSIFKLLNSVEYIDNYPVEHVKYAWKGSSAVTVFDKELSQFLVTDIRISQTEVVYPAGSTFPCRDVHISLGRIF